MRPIDADALIEFCAERWITLNIDAVNMQPTIQPEPKTGKWIGTEFDGYADGNPVFYEWQCSECGCIFEDEEPTYKFCPNCGAKMKGETK